MKLCIDCQWYGGVAIATGRDVCKHPDNKHIDPVHGLDHNYDCQQLRKKEDMCGLEGKWWAPKPPLGAGPPRGP